MGTQQSILAKPKGEDNEFKSAAANTRRNYPSRLSNIGGALGSLNQTLPAGQSGLESSEVDVVVTTAGSTISNWLQDVHIVSVGRKPLLPIKK